jgi:hypothetical protein
MGQLCRPNEYIPPPRLYQVNPGEIRKELAGVIISFCNCSSFDSLFSTVQQRSVEGSQVLTYAATSGTEEALIKVLNRNFTKADVTLRECAGAIDRLSRKSPASVVFNWECSSGFAAEKLGSQSKAIYELLGIVISRGYMAMFSDFSLKALINEWDEKTLGPNPFVKVGETGETIKMKFDKDQLLACPSSQLQAVARLSTTDEISVHAMGGTIQYAVDQKREQTNLYEVEVLTLASNFPAPSPHLWSSLKGYKSLPAHVLMK